MTVKTRLYNQVLAHRFGTELLSLLEGREWNRFEFGVAWVRRSGTQRILEALRRFARNGGVIRGTVGIDIENTSREGLEDLVSLSGDGDVGFFVYHNEAAGTTFHPKVYLLTSDTSASLIIGSSNLTEGGLYRNTEVGVLIDGAPTQTLVREAGLMLATWRDPSLGLVRPLDRGLIRALVANGYVFSETKLNERRARVKRKQRGRKRTSLFGKSPVTSPPSPRPRRRSRRRGARTTVEGQILLMRVRRASATSRRTQVQIPFSARRLPFLRGVAGVSSRHSGVTHKFRVAKARGGQNTIKLELPEIDLFRDPVVRFERVKNKVYYTAYDATDRGEGRQIWNALKAGRDAVGNETVLTLPRSPKHSTWYRFG